MPQGFVSFAEVKRLVSLEAVLARYDLRTGLTEKGQNLVGPCPFCRGKSTRQFQVNLRKKVWFCFGCKEGGNVLDFVAKKEKTSLRSAALQLDTWFSLGLPEEAQGTESAAPPQASAPAAPVEALPVKADTPPPTNPPLAFTLKTLDPRHASLEALRLKPSTIERFEAGYCAKGLLKGRLAIPIRNAAGELVAYAGLAVESEASPRYLFPPKFHPSLEVFNLERLVGSLGGADPLYLTPEIEGVLRLSDLGVMAAIGLFDGSLSTSQEEVIRGALPRFERLVLVGDGFPERTVARLARHAPVTWVSELPAGAPTGESLGEEP